MPRNPPEAIGTALGKTSKIPRFHGFDLESALLDKGRDIASNVATFERPLKEGFCSLLPTAHVNVRRKAVFEEQKLTAGFQHARDAAKCVDDARDGAQRECADDRIRRGIRE